ncbi:hypothetical protein EASAB2608_00217 [Streptomyces sp. EAS-AB2608]|nr:hypothetical protein EASAB2608_00217 [Streptomyces sp. EAS-AB2608]
MVDTVAAQYATLLSGLARAGTDETVRSVLPQAPEGQWRRFAERVRRPCHDPVPAMCLTNLIRHR